MTLISGQKCLGTVAYLGGVPAMLSQFVWSYGQMIQYNAEFIATQGSTYIHYEKVDYSDHAPARNHLANSFEGNWLMQLDTDHSFSPDLLERILHLVKTYDVDVISGLYQLKKPPHVYVCWITADEGRPRPLATFDPAAKLIEISAAGAGCLWVKRSVFDRIRNELGCEPFDRDHATSEDHSFFRKCNKLGIKCYLAPQIQYNHLVTVPVTPDDLDVSSMNVEEYATEGFGK